MPGEQTHLPLQYFPHFNTAVHHQIYIRSVSIITLYFNRTVIGTVSVKCRLLFYSMPHLHGCCFTDFVCHNVPSLFLLSHWFVVIYPGVPVCIVGRREHTGRETVFMVCVAAQIATMHFRICSGTDDVMGIIHNVAFVVSLHPFYLSHKILHCCCSDR